MTIRKSRIVKIPPSVYQSLLNKVRKTLVEGQARIEAERVRIYWETGRLINRHILKRADRAEYGSEVILSLAKDLNVDRSVLNRCVKFAEKYPRVPIGAGRHQFKWSHYRSLITIPDDDKRLGLEKNVREKGWTADELESRLKEGRASEDGPVARFEDPVSYGAPQKPLVPLRGRLYTYRLVERPILSAEAEQGLLVDLGFGVYHEADNSSLSGFSENQIIESRPKDDAYKFYKTEQTAKDLFTYAAYVEKVIDGDTVKVRLDLGFNVWTRQTLRLRDIDCPEVGAPEGDEARSFVRLHLKESQMIIVRSSRSDKYDRYLADIYIPQSGGDPDAETDVYLNNLLLETHRAVRMG